MNMKSDQTLNYFRKLKKQYQKWHHSTDLTPPSAIPLHDRFTKKTFYNVLGSNKINSLPRVEILCQQYPELEQLRQNIWDMLKDRKKNTLRSFWKDAEKQIQNFSSEHAKYWANFYYNLIARRIQRHKLNQLRDPLSSHRGIEIPPLIKVSKKINERIYLSLEEISTRIATPDEAFFEMQASIAHTLNDHLERLTTKSPWPVKKMFQKAYHSIREAVAGVYVLEQTDTLSAWGSARSLPWYDTIAEEVSYRCAKEGFSTKTGAGPGTMDAALKGCHRYIQESLMRGIDPKVEAIGVPGNFVKLKEQPSKYMTYRIDHYDLDIRKLLLKYSNVILVFPGRAGTDEELYSILVELLTDYSDAAKYKQFLPIIVIVGDYQRRSLLHHILVEMGKYKNSHNDEKPLFYFIPLDHENLKKEYETGKQMEEPETKEVITLITDLVVFCKRSLGNDFSSFFHPKLINSIDLRKEYLKLELK